MQIKDLDELEKSFNDASASLNSIKSLSEIIFDCVCRNDYKLQDIQNLTDVLNEL
jgi:hypothetical protein